MYFLILFLSIFAFVKTLGYAIFEYKDNSNKVAGIIIGILSIVSLIRPNYYNFDKIEKYPFTLYRTQIVKQEV